MKKYLRTLLCLLLALSLVLCLAACDLSGSGDDEDEDEEKTSDTKKEEEKEEEEEEQQQEEEEEEQVSQPTTNAGNYKIYSMSYEGISMDANALTSAGYNNSNMYMQFLADGSGVLCMDGEVININWTNTSISSNGEVINYTTSGDLLTIDVEGVVMVFQKTTEEVGGGSSVGTTSSAVAGQYDIYQMVSEGVTYDEDALLLTLEVLEMSSLDELMSMTLNADGTGTLVAMGIEGTIEWDSSKFWPQGAESEAISYTYSGGLLTFEMDGYEYVMKLQ